MEKKQYDFSFTSGEQFHIKLQPGDIGRYVIMPGDPGRCELIAGYLDSPVRKGTFREFNIYSGYLEGELVSVCSSGIGGPSTAILVEELANLGAEYIIRVGTCGAIDINVMGGDVIIPTGAIRFEGTTAQYVPVQFPAVPDHELVGYLKQAAVNLKRRFHLGVIQSKDSFYGQHDPAAMPASAELLAYWDAWKKMGALGSEMECSTLFIVGQYKKVRTGAVILALANQERRKLGLDDPQEWDNNISVAVAVEAFRLLIRDRKQQ